MLSRLERENEYWEHDEDERCSNCGARPNERCEDWCASGRNEMDEAELARELRTDFGPDSDKE